MATLRDRCRAFLEDNPHCSTDDLHAFVIAETGRGGSSDLNDTLALCLYFTTERDRDEFVELFKQAKPGVITKRLS